MRVSSLALWAMSGLLLCINAGAAPELPPAIKIDITAIVDPIAPGEGVGYAGIGFDGTNFWISRWASARFTRISPAGVFVDSFRATPAAVPLSETALIMLEDGGETVMLSLATALCIGCLRHSRTWSRPWVAEAASVRA